MSFCAQRAKGVTSQFKISASEAAPPNRLIEGHGAGVSLEALPGDPPTVDGQATGRQGREQGAPGAAPAMLRLYEQIHHVQAGPATVNVKHLTE